MCGIAGYISINNIISAKQLQQASLLMKHRGPNAEGFYFAENDTVGLAHRRLSILDLSTAANQPMFSADGRYCIVFNGEIYNFKELQLQLADKGTTLKTSSDTEVILELFIQQGTRCFAQMNGMFALAIYDTREKILTLCRDHVGVKPLFIYQDKSTILFASELKVIKSMMGEQLTINKEAIPYFLHFGFIPQPLTIFNDTVKFPAAHYTQVDVGQQNFNESSIQYIPFWKLEQVIESSIITNESAAKKQLTGLLFEAVEKQLVSDVPIGTFLSGGVDSSLVTAIASKISGSNQLNTFSIGIDDGKFNESKYARQVAAHLQTTHHEFKVKENEVLELVDQLIPAFDEPFADSSAFPTMMVSRLAKQHVTVALSGDGGDELLHGYGSYQWAKRLAAPHWQLLKAPVYAGSRMLNSKYQRTGNMFAYQNKRNIISHIISGSRS